MGHQDFLPASETIPFLSQLSNATLRRFSSSSAARLGSFYKKTRYINLLLLLLLLSRVCTVVQYAVLEPMATVCGKTKNFVINEER